MSNDPQHEPLESQHDPSVYEPLRDPAQMIYLHHPSMNLKIIYWSGRVADLLIERLGYTEITREEYERED